MKKKEQKSINTYVITRHNIAISHNQQWWRSRFRLIQTCLQFFNKRCWQKTLKSNLKDPSIELPKRRVHLNFTMLNRYDGADLTFLFKKGLSLIIRRIFFNSNTNLLFSFVNTQGTPC